MGQRIEGRRGVALRRERIRQHPVCAECAKRGLVRATEVIDHIQPLALGGEDVDSNCQGLCHLCHAIKTAMESPSAEAVSNHPEWLRPAVKRISVVCGAPCSGKTTLVAGAASAADAVIDLDAIVERLSPGYRPWVSPLDPAILNRAIRIRNEVLGSLAVKPGRVAWLIVGAPTHMERMWWKSKLGERCSIVLLDPPMAVCIERAHARGTPAAVEGIRRWHEQSRQPWRVPKAKLKRVAFGDDGYPLEES